MKFRSILCGVLTAAILTVPSFAADFTDTEGHWAQAAIDRWSSYGVVSGYDDGRFGPNDSITRAQMAVILDRIFGWKEQEENRFLDMQGTEWFAGAVLRANAAGVLNGSEGNTRPNAPITRQEAAVMLNRALALSGKGESKTFTDESMIGAWAKGAVEVMSGLGLIAGTPSGAFEPSRSITRAEMLTILNRAVAAYYDRAGVYTDNVAGVVCVIAAPGVTLRDMTIDGELLIVPGAEGSETILNNVTVTGQTRILSGQDARVLVKGESHLNALEIAGDQGRLQLDDTVEMESLTVSGSGVHVRGLAEDMRVSVAENAQNVLVNGHPAQSGSVVQAGKDISSDADDAEIVVKPDDSSSAGGNQGETSKPEQPSEPTQPEKPTEPENPIEPEKPAEPDDSTGGTRDEEGNIIIDFDDLINGEK